MTNSTSSDRAVRAWGARSKGQPLEALTIERRAPRAHDVVIDVMFCGVCHSDIHQARDEWGGALFPMVPGHEIIGRVVDKGGSASVAIGDLVGVGCVVDSCQSCGACHGHHEQFCERGPAFTYNSTEMDRSTPTYGGYSTRVVVDEHFVLRVPTNLDAAAAAPLLCAGITTWSPLKRFDVGAGARVGVVGLGGLGHMAVRLAKSLGAEVTVLSSSESKRQDAARLGAAGFAVVGDTMPEHLAKKLDVIVDTVSANHDIDGLLGLLRPYGALALVGAPPSALSIQPFSLIGAGRTLVGSMIGGMKETQEMLDHCGAHGIVSDVEVIKIQQINEAWERVLQSDVRYRFVVDVASLR